MEQINDKLKRLEEIQKELKEISLGGLSEIDEKIPIPKFESYCFYMLNLDTNQYKRVTSRGYSVGGVQYAKLCKDYLIFVKDVKQLRDFYERQYKDIVYANSRNLINQNIRKRHINKNLIRVLEITTGREHSLFEIPYILEDLPKPTEEEYCNLNIRITKYAKIWRDSSGELCDIPSDDELMVEFKREYKSFIKSVLDIKEWYEFEEFKQKQKEREKRHLNKLREIFKARGFSDNKLDEEVKIYIEGKQLKEDFIAFVKIMKRWYRYGMKPKRIRHVIDYDQLDIEKEEYNESERNTKDAYNWLLQYDDYAGLKEQGLLPDEWYEP